MRINCVKGLGPFCRNQLPILADIGLVQSAMRQAINGMACFVRRPFFVHIIIDTRQGAQYGPAPAVETDVGANGVHDVDAWGLFQFPRTRLKGIRLRGQRANGAKINNIARKLALHGVL